MTWALFWKVALIFEAGFLAGFLFALFWRARGTETDATLVVVTVTPDAATRPIHPRPLGALRPESLN